MFVALTKQQIDLLINCILTYYGTLETRKQQVDKVELQQLILLLNNARNNVDYDKA